MTCAVTVSIDFFQSYINAVRHRVCHTDLWPDPTRPDPTWPRSL